ncbi:hypothetical protein KY290_021755 [Solanum tuberosum]|uniref:PB1 domain-containing protein n=1 Tax=Solanum tuberosum TaxID=4113 RepID=A0ABQ7V2E6_SOLTU|nr:hypothetical protein KY290_021755 [Solanum tuberosum]
MSYFELRDYIRNLGYSTTCSFSIKPPNNGILVDVNDDMNILDMMCSLEDGDVVEVFVKHLADELTVEPMLIENGEYHLNSEDPFATFSSSSLFTSTPHATANGATIGDDDIDVGPAGSDFSEEKVEDFDYSTEDSVEFEAELVRDNDEEEYRSDVHEQVRELRAE